MKKFIFLSILIPLVAFVSCNKEDDVDYSSEIIGAWRYAFSEITVRTNNEAASEAIEKALKFQGQDITFTVDKKYFEASTEAGTYDVSGNKLTVKRTDGETHSMELLKPDKMLHITEDITERFQSDFLDFENLEIYTLKVTSKYSKI
ncbi:MAG: hypothetical protein LBL57_04230 [Tannerella sp.]|jgi:type I restriction-modification system DNA methylase subunit|nr:hypothetical protein [Tannerella sp.]